MRYHVLFYKDTPGLFLTSVQIVQIYFLKQGTVGGWYIAQVVVYLPSVHEVPGSIPGASIKLNK